MSSSLRVRLLLTGGILLVLSSFFTLLSSGRPLLTGVLAAGTALLTGWLVLVRPAERQLQELRRESRGLASSHSAMVDDLKRERDLLGGILETMQEGVLLLDEHDQIVLLNPSLRSTLLLAKDVVGKTLLTALRRAELCDLVEEARKHGEPLVSEISLGGLKPRRLTVRANPMRTPAGAILLVFSDTTEIRRLESMRRDFVANVSHELRTPVTAICSAAETLLNGALQDSTVASSFVEMIERNSHRLRQLVEDLLDLSRIESKEYKLDRRPVQILPIVRRTLSLLEEKANKGHVRTDIDMPPTFPLTRADDRALEQVLVNLVDNAIKYCPPGSRVVVRAEIQSENLVRVAVQDTGPGISERDLPRLFERFYRVDTGRSRDMGGTGLGLSIVKHLVEAMGGRVGVESRLGFGSTFWLTLPRVQESTESSACQSS